MGGPVLPWSFGHICSSWRHVALADHRLWNRIQFQVDDIHPCHTQMLETVLLRSGSAPLDIEMIARYSFTSVFDFVLPHTGRISRLNLYAHPGDFSSILSEFSGRGRTLSSLSEAMLVGTSLELLDGDIHIFGDRPLLRNLTIRLCGYQPELLDAICWLHIPFSQLTEHSLELQSPPLHAMNLKGGGQCCTVLNQIWRLQSRRRSSV